MESLPKPRVLLLGSQGQLGVELAKLLPATCELTALSRREVDLADPAALRSAVRNAQPQFIVNAAAYTAVDRAESEPQLAYAINSKTPEVLAEEALRAGAWLVHYSTDYVFDGSSTRPWLETDAPAPLNVYGKSKLAGEQAITATGCRHLIFRTSWVYSSHGNNFLRTMMRLAAERPCLTIVNDQIGAPTSANQLAQSTAEVLLRLQSPTATFVESGLYHMSCAGSTTWFGFAQAIFSALADKATVPELIPIPTSGFKTAAARPAYSVLSNAKLQRTFGLRLPPWQEALHQVIREII